MISFILIANMQSIVPFGYDTLKYKNTHHHYCGFYSLNVLAEIIDNIVVVWGKQYIVSEETAIDWSYDGKDTIVAEKRLVYSRREWPLHSLIYNINHEIVGLVTPGINTTDDDYCYAVQDGFKLYNNHLSNINLIVREKVKLIVYADQQFKNKQDLLLYIEKPTSNNSGSILYYSGNKSNAQLVIYCNGFQISNSQLRKKIFGVL